MFHITHFNNTILVSLSPATKLMDTNSSCPLNRNLCLSTGSSTLAPWGIPSANGQSRSKLQCFLEKSHMKSGSGVFLPSILTLLWESRPHWIQVVARVSTTPMSSIILNFLRKLLRRRRFHGKMPTIWMRKGVKEGVAGRLLQRSILCLRVNIQSTKLKVQTLSSSQSLNVYLWMVRALLQGLCFPENHITKVGSRHIQTFGMSMFHHFEKSLKFI